MRVTLPTIQACDMGLVPTLCEDRVRVRLSPARVPQDHLAWENARAVALTTVFRRQSDEIINRPHSCQGRGAQYGYLESHCLVGSLTAADHAPLVTLSFRSRGDRSGPSRRRKTSFPGQYPIYLHDVTRVLGPRVFHDALPESQMKLVNNVYHVYHANHERWPQCRRIVTLPHQLQFSSGTVFILER